MSEMKSKESKKKSWKNSFIVSLTMTQSLNSIKEKINNSVTSNDILLPKEKYNKQSSKTSTNWKNVSKPQHRQQADFLSI